MASSIEIASIDDQISLIPQTEKIEIEEGRTVDNLIDINQIFDKKFKDLENSSIKSRTIFKVNVWLRESNRDAYTPKMVSIGPYHKTNPQLRPMEKYKLLYLKRFLGRKEGLDVESCIKALEGLKEEAMKCYDDVETDKFCQMLLHSNEFCQMLLLDGCFVVEFIRGCCGIRPIGGDITIKINPSDVLRDLLLLENQLPFFILVKLHHMTKQDNEDGLALLVEDCFFLFVDLPQATNGSIKETPEGNIRHLLHLVHIVSCPRTSTKKPKDDHLWHMVMPNATELSEVGVRFGTYRNWTSLFDIKFENGSMKIPPLRIFDHTETLLRNLIAYEQQSWDVNPTYFSDFAIFIDNLIESDKDVTLLRRKGIIVNFMGEDKQVANLFNKMGTGVTTSPDFYYNEEFGKATKYYKGRGNKMKAHFRQYYCSSPWVAVSTLAAIILLILTTMQTVLAFIK